VSSETEMTTVTSPGPTSVLAAGFWLR
jgi:hypothetical protein